MIGKSPWTGVKGQHRLPFLFLTLCSGTVSETLHSNQAGFFWEVTDVVFSGCWPQIQEMACTFHYRVEATIKTLTCIQTRTSIVEAMWGQDSLTEYLGTPAKSEYILEKNCSDYTDWRGGRVGSVTTALKAERLRWKSLNRLTSSHC